MGYFLIFWRTPYWDGLYSSHEEALVGLERLMRDFGNLDIRIIKSKFILEALDPECYWRDHEETLKDMNVAKAGVARTKSIEAVVEGLSERAIEMMHLENVFLIKDLKRLTEKKLKSIVGTKEFPRVKRILHSKNLTTRGQVLVEIAK
jgi:hypothetical protein